MYDDIVIGAGSSGAVIASRLSEDPARKVLLLEAGNDYPSLALTPKALLDPNVAVLTGHNWHIPAQSRDAEMVKSLLAAGQTFLKAGMQDQRRMASTVLAAGASPAKAANSFDYAVGKVVGGSSAVNGALAFRGLPEDYDEWARLTGDDDWSWQSVLQSFIALENDTEAGAYHGRDGAVPVSREDISALTPLQRAFFDTCIAKGYPQTKDHNAPESAGVGVVPKLVRDGVRMSSALTHLLAARQRTNLHLRPNTLVDRLHWNGASCVGVEAIVDGARSLYQGRRIILCAGALNTPCILMRSGVGNPVHLKRLNVPVRLSLSGVGMNLQDHPIVGFWAAPEAFASTLGESTHQVLLRYTSQRSPSRNDMQISMVSGLDATQIALLRQALGSPLAAAVATCVAKPLSTGYLRMTSANPTDMPSVVTNCLAEHDDMRRMKEGVRIAWDMVQSPGIRQNLRQIFAWNSAMFTSDSILEKAISTFVRPAWHVTGTARMGRAADPAAVVDSRGGLIGANNVWIADASIMPTIPSAATHLSCVMLAERIAAGLLQSD